MNWPCSRDSTRDRAGRGEESPSQERRPDSLPMKVPRSGPQKTTPQRRGSSIKLTSSELMRLLRGPLVSASPSPFFFRDAPFQTTSRWSLSYGLTYLLISEFGFGWKKMQGNTQQEGRGEEKKTKWRPQKSKCIYLGHLSALIQESLRIAPIPE